MKKWTKKTINTFIEIGNKDATSENAERAKKKLGIPEKLWMELSEIYKNNAYKSIYESDLKECIKLNMLFMLGFAIGWAEKNNKIK